MKKNLRVPLLALLAVPMLALAAPAIAEECPEPAYYEPCTGCHVPGLNPNVELAYTTWLESEHLNGVTFGSDFCKDCHQSFRGDPGTCDQLAPDSMNGIECATCHTERISEECDRELRVWDRASCDYGPLIDHDNLDELCLTCHDRPDIVGHSAFFAPPQGWGKAMLEQKGVMCVDCHMPKVPFEGDTGSSEGRTHNWKVAENLPYSCGTLEGGCHSNKTSKWALKQIEKNKIHGLVD
jgi:formate-dependent nitrite reductase cytochrome c552 subunit